MADQELTLTWLGHAALRARWAGKTFLIDPFLAHNPKTPPAEKQPQAADAILITHGHSDHTGDVVELAKRTGAAVVGIYEVALWLQSQGVPASQVYGMNKGGSLSLAGARITMVHAVHSSSLQDQDGRVIYLGEAAGYVIRFGDGPAVYFAGDTNVFADMKLIADLYQPDVACLPIGDFYTMGPREAAYAANLLGVRTVLPIHWGTLPALSGTPEALAQELEGGSCNVVAWQPGQSYTVIPE